MLYVTLREPDYTSMTFRPSLIHHFASPHRLAPVLLFPLRLFLPLEVVDLAGPP